MLSSLRARLALTFALVVALSLLVAALSLAALLRGYSARLVQARLDDVAMIVFFQARAMVLRGETPIQIVDVLTEQADRLDVQLLLLDREGRVLRQTGQAANLVGLRVPLSTEPPTGPPRQPQNGRFGSPRNGNTYQFAAVPIVFPAGRLGEAGFLAVVQPEGSMLALLRSLATRLAVAAGAGLLAGLIAAILLARWLGRPLARLLAATQAMTRGDYAQRVPLSGPPELVRLSDSFNKMADEVERSRQMVHRFVSTLSHELRTPLTSIRGFAQAVLDGSASSPDELQRAMRIVDREARRMQRLTAELLDFSRLQTGEVPMRREPVELTALVRQCAEVLAARAQEQNVALDLSLPDNVPVEGDADRLEQVFTNLLDNAIKFTPGGQAILVRAEIVGLAPPTASARGRDGRRFGRPRTPPPSPRRCAVVEVANPGPQIPADELPLIFELFYTGSEGRERGGTGLGLPVAREIARAHGGDLTAESSAGLTTFRVMLPADDAR